MKYHYLELFHNFSEPAMYAKSSLLYKFRNDSAVESFSR